MVVRLKIPNAGSEHEEEESEEDIIATQQEEENEGHWGLGMVLVRIFLDL